MGRVLPILFNTDMVRAILDGRKTVTRRVIRYKYSNTEMKMRTDKYGTRLIEIQKDIEGETHGKNPDGSTWHKLLPYIEKNPPYRKSDTLYVRETWREHSPGFDNLFIYKADYADGSVNVKWHPSIHMPKEAARIWLKVTDVKVERLQDITEEQAIKEGITCVKYDVNTGKEESAALDWFPILWDSTVKKSDSDCYGWDANPWVWVIEFERCEKPEEN
ncbi:MAG: hypothetical protein HFI95_15570 [Lachnospiraceae bacterium]|nr:hypothetical protein [Lachnospiraceae bacterium]